MNDPGEPCVLFSRENENNLQAHICRTEGLLHFFFQWGDVCRDDNVFGSILDRMKMICASIMEFSWHLQQQFVFEKLQSVCGTHVSGGILITGFLQALKNRFPRSWLTFKTIWIELKNSGRIQADWPLSFNNTVGFVDVLMFTFSAMRWRRKQNKSTDSLQPLIALLRFDLIMIISKVLNSYIPLNVQTDFRFTIARNLPAVRRKSKSDGPVRVEVDPETIWALIESANNSGISLRQALLLKKNDELSSPELAGASESKAEYWMRKLTGLYMYRVQNVFQNDHSVESGCRCFYSFRQGNFGLVCIFSRSKFGMSCCYSAFEHGIIEAFRSGCFCFGKNCKEQKTSEDECLSTAPSYR